MNKIINKYLLAIDGSTEYLSIALLKNYEIMSNEELLIETSKTDVDVFTTTLLNFLGKQTIPFDSILNFYVGCGPGSFTNIRRTLSFSKGLRSYHLSKKNIGENTPSFIGINSLACLAYDLQENLKGNENSFILSMILANNDEYYIQIFQLNKRKYFPLTAISNIKLISIHNIKKFVEDLNINYKKILIAAKFSKHSQEQRLIINKYNIYETFPKAEYIGKLGHNLTNLKNKCKKQLEINNIFNNYLNPIYAKPPNTN